MSRPALLSRIIPAGTLNRNLRLLCISNFFGAFGDGLFVYTLPIYLRGLEASPADVGLLYSILSLSSALTIIPGGFLADRFDRKKIMILGWAIWVPVPLMFSLATHWSQLPSVMSVYGFFIAGPAISAYVATSANKERITVTFTAISASWSLGYIFSPALGGYISTHVGTSSVFFLAFALYALATVTLFFVQSQNPKKLNDEKSSASTSSRSFDPRKIILLSIYFATAIFLLSITRPLIVQFLKDVFIIDSFQIGVLGSVTFSGWAVISIVLGKIGDKWTKATAVATALVLGSISLIVLISFNNFPVLVLASFIDGGSYPLWSLMGAAVGSIAPEMSRGRWISVSQTITTLTAFIAPYLGGILYEASPYTPFYVVIVATLLLSLVAFTKPLKER
jgi:ACDE family multidrug resistance protein